jgi:protein-tyrosine phosphatase
VGVSDQTSGFVDIHGHVIPSGDDGVRSIEEALGLLREAADRGTAVQYATPHANERFPLTASRRRRAEEAHAELVDECAGFGLDLQLGFELAGEPWLLDEDPRDYRLGSLPAALLEFPLPYTGTTTLELVTACGEHIEAAGLVPILAHPERCRMVHDAVHLVREYRERGWLTQVNSTSLLGRDGSTNERVGWELVRDGLCDVVATDAHRAHRPPFLDRVHAALAARVGREQADRLTCGVALPAPVP